MTNRKQRLLLGAIIICHLMMPFSSEGMVFQSQQTENDIILITGFKPFDIYDVNPSELIALHFNNTQMQDYTIKGYVLPVDYLLAPEKMKQLIETFDPVLIISLGLDGNKKRIQIETLALNLRINPEKRIPFLTLKKINVTGPYIQFSTFDISNILLLLNENNISVEQSFFAGLYLCNAILYETLLYQTVIQQSIPTGFIHVPLLISQHAEGMALEDMITAVHFTIMAHIS
ncbi:MAG: hypothetical protein QCI00_00690 [Candidatus Thermoplasmatota archaeon]|nr:hypothetical protein [Candidatus Thermoplasmatota archaeon]